MKIDRVTLYHLRMSLCTPFETSFGRIHERECILLAVRAEGLTGYGECVADRDPGYAYETVGTAWHILRDFLVPAVMGQELTGPADFQARAARVRGHNMAKAGLELALWDLAGQRAGRSLRDLLGGARERVEVGVSVGIQPSPDALAETVDGYLAQATVASKSRSSRATTSSRPGPSVARSPTSASRWTPTRPTRWSPRGRRPRRTRCCRWMT